MLLLLKNNVETLWVIIFIYSVNCNCNRVICIPPPTGRWGRITKQRSVCFLVYTDRSKGNVLSNEGKWWSTAAASAVSACCYVQTTLVDRWAGCIDWRSSTFAITSCCCCMFICTLWPNCCCEVEYGQVLYLTYVTRKRQRFSFFVTNGGRTQLTEVYLKYQLKQR